MAEQKTGFLGEVITVGEDNSVLFPSRFLEGAGINPGSRVEIFGNKEYVFIRTVETFCDICGANANVIPFGQLNVCQSDYEKLTTPRKES
ncbi:hypothetical protein CN613_25715 [Bacillus pseudomycoides]|uniref:AbrB family transcriptional regulator n=1 Tax=Bacillus pseudomycoides TaxID=64104 RepID=A0A2A8BYN8_9BACI|nr:hypothetical protein [Bacillus pseudomycoides]PEM65343.1 hypothetical protein CN613_25715 [Bacillus pseudomycoides]